MSTPGGPRRGTRRAVLCAAVLVAPMCASRAAQAQFTPTGTSDRKLDPEVNNRTVRSGLVVSLMLGYGISTASGYPNNSNQIGDSDYYSASDVMGGTGGGLFVGGALADYLNVGFFFLSQGFRSSSWESRIGAGGLRLEAFPLVYVVPSLKGLGLFANFGIGSATLDVKLPGDYPEAHGVQSIVGVGGMYEFTIFHLFGGHAVFGPTLEYDAVFAQSISSGSGVLGARIAFYGGK